ncbi:hypothetical protein CEXT_510321 [Caerostris extrusa]|uniref:Uncharacterized protein n=1 Tax=Caerostris extrusa TaxID=172846 RepID=A0AAV4NRQ1_CAEEX|nr:hypothetical protein CEXT_510321 [Caerostris extrusa]
MICVNLHAGGSRTSSVVEHPFSKAVLRYHPHPLLSIPKSKQRADDSGVIGHQLLSDLLDKTCHQLNVFILLPFPTEYLMFVSNNQVVYFWRFIPLVMIHY